MTSESNKLVEINKSFPRLFKYNNTNKVVQWFITIDPVSTGYQITTVYGEVDGKQTMTSKIIAKGNAGRTKLEQAVLDAKSKWTNKHDKEMYMEQLQEKNSMVRPMLAQTYTHTTPHKTTTSRAYKMPTECFVQPKLDGLRCLAYIKNGEIRLESRKGIEFHNMSHIKEQLEDSLKSIRNIIWMVNYILKKCHSKKSADYVDYRTQQTRPRLSD